MRMTARSKVPTRAAYALAAMRALAGAMFLAAPTRAGSGWMGADAENPGARMAIRGMGSRDLAIALGHIRALRGHGPGRPWALTGAIADAGDCLATLAAGRRLSTPRLVAGSLTAGAAAAAGVWLAGRDH